ncbi:MAG: SufD family Fe-S cluster assembly protein [Muribaculaceae bacterium]|jgi:Fe-S cluster assembly protein SufD|nr:SufD family Fe-S cluster assembly protein [Muribaculaceae bacterium]
MSISAKESFGQYLALCNDFEGKRNASPLLSHVNRLGREALVKAVEGYRRDPLAIDAVEPAEFFAPDYGVNLGRVALDVDPAGSFRCGVPNLNSLLVIVANDAFRPTQQLIRNMPQGLTVCSLNAVPDALRERVESIISRSLAKGDAATALNALLLGDGVLVHAAEGVKIDKAIQIVNISNPLMPILSPRCVVVIAEKNADVKVLLCDHSQTDSVAHMNLETIHVDLAENARAEIYDIEEGNAGSRRCMRFYANQASHSSLTVNATGLRGGVTSNEYHIAVPGNEAETSLSGLSICSGSQVYDTKVSLTHSGKHCSSRQMFKNAMFDNSRGGFGGKIIVEQNAMFTDAAQTNRNLLIGDTARMAAAPQLEIYCDEVKCSHGATTGQLDERAVFYMQTRGIPAEEARRMLTQTFMSDIIDHISFEVLRQRIHLLVERRLSGASGNCDTCATACHTEPEL